MEYAWIEMLHTSLQEIKRLTIIHVSPRLLPRLWRIRVEVSGGQPLTVHWTSTRIFPLLTMTWYLSHSIGLQDNTRLYCLQLKLLPTWVPDLPLAPTFYSAPHCWNSHRDVFGEVEYSIVLKNNKSLCDRVVHKCCTNTWFEYDWTLELEAYTVTYLTSCTTFADSWLQIVDASPLSWCLTILVSYL